MKKAGAYASAFPASRLHKIEVREAAVQDGRGGRLEPLVQQGRVDGAEVGVHPQVAVVEVRQAGVFAVDAALDGPAREEHDAGRPVVGAGRAVLLDAPAELREGHGDVASVAQGGAEGERRRQERCVSHA